MNIPASEALVLVSYGSSGIVEMQSGERLDCKYRRSVGRPVCGDRVLVSGSESDESSVVSAILPRSNEFMRANAKQKKQIIAANLDQVMIVIAPEPEPSRDLVERYLVAVHSLGIEPVLVVNKSELLDPGRHDRSSSLGRLDEYAQLGYQVVKTSCKGLPGTDSLLPALQTKTSILVGQSGVGKSSLVNALLPDLELQTGALSRVTGKGTHTTTTTIMYTLPCSGRLIDSPGVWEYGLWQMEQRDLAAGFGEFSPYATSCRFNDCSHRGEPGCGVRKAAESGQVRAWRYASYLRLLEQNS
ncbi:MAG: ribosome small subunit-dependent GTPase A [Xanthomonadales bacterium]|nr:ribosome small subunit-dependent GTPase A [Xanthomonadales bacterium]